MSQSQSQSQSDISDKSHKTHKTDQSPLRENPGKSAPPPKAPQPTPADGRHKRGPEWFQRLYDRFLHDNGTVATFLRSTLVSQLSSWTDTGFSFVFYAWVFIGLGASPMRSFLATAIGLVAGGIVNCSVNYRFTFRSDHCSIKAVAVKYFLIWSGNFVFNLGGTTLLDHVLQGWDYLRTIPWIKPDGIFVAARLSVSLVVSLFWNFLMQKNFVYVKTRFDPYAIRFVDFLTRKRRPSPEK